MNIPTFIPRCLAGIALITAPSLGLAQTTSVIVGPLGANAPIPTLTENMLIVLGLLLAVVAVRALRSQRGSQKFLSLLLLGTGLVVGGIGVERSIAGGGAGAVVAMGSTCSQTGPINYDPNEITTLQNGCPVDIEIKDFSSTECELDIPAAECKKGQVLAPDEICNSLPECPME